MTMPLLVLTVFAAIETTHRWHLENMLKLATAEAVKAGAKRGADSQDAQAVFAEHVGALGIQNAVLTTSADFDNQTPGNPLSASAVANWTANRTYLPGAFAFGPDNLTSGVVTYRREGL